MFDGRSEIALHKLDIAQVAISFRIHSAKSQSLFKVLQGIIIILLNIQSVALVQVSLFGCDTRIDRPA